MKASMTVNLGMAIASVLLAGTALAQEPPAAGPGSGFGDHRPPFERAMGEHGHWWNKPEVAERLKLTDAQRKAMDDTLQQHRETLVDLRGSLEKAELELEPMMKEAQPNESQILGQIDKVAQARAELEKANARFLLAIRSKLTPEQWQQMEADRASRPRAVWSRDSQGGPAAEGRGSRALRRSPAGEGQAAPPPPGGPQSMLDGGPDMDASDLNAPPPPQEGADAVQ